MSRPADSGLADRKQPLAAYVHFPWCVRKCPYCDFNSHPAEGAFDEARYLEALIRDIQATEETLTARPQTLFFGGGTPSLFSPDSFATLIEALGQEAREVTMEANPGTTEHADFSNYRQAGINRLSLGAQSFNDRHLTTLGRIHSSEETARAFETARRGGFDNINLDLMYALPEQTVDEALQDLQRAIALEPEHISWYQLTLEPKTEFHARPPKLPAEEAVDDMEREGRRLLTASGFEQYEVSAWSRPGKRCQHNLNYWLFGDYVGVGAGAHGKRTGTEVVRTRKHSQPRLYMREPTTTEETAVSPQALPFEFLMNALRLTEGTTFERFEAATKLTRAALEPSWSKGAEHGLVQTERICTTPLGYQYLDSLLTRYFSSSDELSIRPGQT